MKRIYILITLLMGISSGGFCRISSAAIPQKDSIVILFGKKTQIVIHTEDKQEFQKLKDFDFNALFEQVISVTESSPRTQASKDTSFVVNGDSVIIKGNDVLVKDNDKSVSFTIRIGKNKDRETDEVAISEDDSTVVVIRSKRSDPRNKDKDRKVKRHKRTEGEFRVDLGLNNYLQNGEFPDESNQPYGLRPFGSRYIALGYIYKTRIGKEKSPFYLTHGLEFSANNFMFDSDARIRRGAEGIEFEETGLNLKKNKLTVLYVSLPVMPMLDFKRAGEGTFRFGFGGYVGYRIHSYSKIMYEENGKRKDHEQDSYYLNNFRYGLQTQISFWKLNLFAKYDLNPLFNTGKGPELHALSFGIRL